MSARFPVITLCGSMRYQHQMMEHATNLTHSGYIVLVPFVKDYVNAKPPDMIKHMLDDMHKHKIDMSNIVHVVGEHIGTSTRDEINYARWKGVPIFFFNNDLKRVGDR